MRFRYVGGVLTKCPKQWRRVPSDKASREARKRERQEAALERERRDAELRARELS